MRIDAETCYRALAARDAPGRGRALRRELLARAEAWRSWRADAAALLWNSPNPLPEPSRD